MTEKLLPIIIFVTIYTKSSYSFPNRERNNYYFKNIATVRDSVNSSRKPYNPSYSPTGLSNRITKERFHYDYKTLASKIYYDTAKRRFFISDSKNINDVSDFQGRMVRSKSVWGSVVNFFSGGFMDFFVDEKRTRYHRKTKRIPVYGESEEDFDPLGSFLDDIGGFFGSSEKRYQNRRVPHPTSKWNNVPDDIYDQETQPSEIYSREEIYSEKLTDNSPLKVEKNIATEVYSESTVTTTNIPSTTVKNEIIESTTESKIVTETISITSSEIPRKRYKLSTTSSTMSPIQVVKIKRRYKPYDSYMEYDDDDENKRVTIKNRRPSIVSKQTADCVQHPPISWTPPVYSNFNNAPPLKVPPPATTTKAPGGWFSFFSDEDDDDTDEQPAAQSSSSWFTNLFADDSPPITTTVFPQIFISPTTPSPAPIKVPEPNWFDSLLSVEEDDGAYAQNTTGVQKNKKSQRKNYNGYQLIRIYSNSKWKVRKLKTMKEDSSSDLMWWSMPSINRPSDLLVSPSQLSEVKDHLNSEGLEYDVILWDLQKAINYENPRLSKTQRLELERSRGHPLTWKRFHRYSDILRYLEYLSLKYPDMVNLIPLGRSSEGLPIMAAKVSTPYNKTKQYSEHNSRKWKLKSKMKPAIWIDAGMHAREWITPAVATWFLHTLVEGSEGEGIQMDLLKLADWYILPVANPDGYEYTHTRDRLWRKTRSRQSTEYNFINSWLPWNWGNNHCVGVDPNRNWDYHWGERGSSNDPCDDYYAGPHPFSEPETKAISNFLIENREQIKVYITLHSYAQMWVLPMTHSRVPFADESEIMEMGKLAVSAVSDVSGTKYEIGTPSELLQPMTGTSVDWAKGRAGIKYSYAIKLRDSSGPHGFLLPGSEIIPTAKETFEGIKVIVDNLE